MKTRVFILGAGASNPAGAPLINDFLVKGLFYLHQGATSSDSLLNYRELAKYLKHEYGVDINKCNCFSFFEKGGVNIEQIISGLDKEIRNGNKDLITARDQAVRFVYVTLQDAVSVGHWDNCYPDFVNKQIKPNIKTDEHVIITFNYETLLEEELGKQLRGYYSYGIDVDKNKIIDFPSYERTYDGKLLILKLHGSLNWASCTTCSKSYLFWSQRYDHIPSKKCSVCHATLRPILIPPTIFKNLPQKLQSLLGIAKEKISNADELAIIGFALNEYDIEACNLIVESIRANKKVPSFYIADPNAKAICDKIVSKARLNVKKHFKEVVLFKGFRNYLNNKEAQGSKRKRSDPDTEQGTTLRTRRTFS